MTAVLLDASCLKREGLVSAPMLELTRLAESGRVVVVLSDIAVREYLSQQSTELASQLDAAAKSLKSAVRSLRIPDPPTDDLERIGGEIAALEAPLRDSFKDAFNAWADRCRARHVTFDATCIKDVIEDYFSGAGAFSSQKSRKDFPDALILSSARAAASEYDQFHIVAGDEHLRSAASEIGISPYENLIQFLETPIVEQLRKTLAIEQEIGDLAEKLLSLNNMDKIAEWLRTDNDQFECIHLEHDEIAGLEQVGVTVFGAYIDYPVAREISSVQISLASPSSVGRWALALEFETQCRLGFATSWPESMELEGKHDVSIYSADEVVELHELWRANFEAEIIFDLSMWTNRSGLDLPTIDSLLPELNVTRATLQRRG